MRFVLIHGGFHGAWCWERTIPELENLGHEAIAVDLPGHGKRRDEASTLATRRDAIVDNIAPGDVLVGHSGGGYDITLAADAAPENVGHLVYLAAGVPIEGKPLVDASGGAVNQNDSQEEVSQLMDNETGMSGFVCATDDDRMECCDFEAVRNFFYHDCDEKTARSAYERLTPAPTRFLLEPVSLENFWRADLRRSFIRCRDDRALKSEMAKHNARRLGVEPLVIDGSHSPFLSRPKDLAACLVAATATRPIGPLLPH